MKLLFLLQDFPYPPENGVRWKTYMLLKELGQRGHDCHLLCFVKDRQGLRIQEFLKECVGLRVLGVFPARKPSILSRLRGLITEGLPSAGQYISQEFRKRLKVALRETQYDAIHVDMINLVQYSRDLVGHAVVLSVNDAVSLGYSNTAQNEPRPFRRARLTLATWGIRNYERKAYRGMVIHVVSPVDKTYLATLCPTARVEVVELMVGTDFLVSGVGDADTKKGIVNIPAVLSNPGVRVRILEFLSICSPLFHRECPATSIQIIGPGGDPAFIGQLAKWNNVRYLGWVRDYREVLARSSVAIFMEKGGAGVKNRFLQVMALGVPVVASRVVAAGASAQHGVHCLVCEQAEDFAVSTRDILCNKELALRLGKGARELTQQRHTPSRVIEKWEDLYASLLQVAPSASRSGPLDRGTFLVNQP